MKSFLLLLVLTMPALARVGEKYADYSERVGKAATSESRGDSSLYEHKVEGRSVYTMVVEGVIMTEIHPGVEEAGLEGFLNALGYGAMRLDKESQGRPTWWTNDSRVAAEYNAPQKTVMVHDVNLRSRYQKKRAAAPKRE